MRRARWSSLQHRQLCGDQRLETAPAAGEEPLAGGRQADQGLTAIGLVHAPFDPAAPLRISTEQDMVGRLTALCRASSVMVQGPLASMP